jgi:hypothetical protein
VGAVATHGLARWVLAGVATLLVPTAVSPSGSPGAVAVILCVATVVRWISVAPGEREPHHDAGHPSSRGPAPGLG